MDNELHAIQLNEIRNPDDKQWYIECETLAIQKINAQVELLKLE